MPVGGNKEPTAKKKATAKRSSAKGNQNTVLKFKNRGGGGRGLGRRRVEPDLRNKRGKEDRPREVQKAPRMPLSDPDGRNKKKERPTEKQEGKEEGREVAGCPQGKGGKGGKPVR